MHGHDCSTNQRVTMTFHGGEASVRHRVRRHVDEANDPAMWLRPEYGELAKVLVKGDDGPACGRRSGENFLVPWIVRPGGDEIDIVTRSTQRRHGARPDAAIDEQPQVTMVGSTISFATSRFAYSRQA